MEVDRIRQFRFLVQEAITPLAEATIAEKQGRDAPAVYDEATACLIDMIKFARDHGDEIVSKLEFA